MLGKILPVSWEYWHNEPSQRAREAGGGLRTWAEGSDRSLALEMLLICSSCWLWEPSLFCSGAGSGSFSGEPKRVLWALKPESKQVVPFWGRGKREATVLHSGTC